MFVTFLTIQLPHSYSRYNVHHFMLPSFATEVLLAAFTEATQWLDTHFLAPARASDLTEPFRRDTKWLGNSHCSSAVAKLASGCNSSLWLGYWVTHCLTRAFTQATAMHIVNSDCWLHWKVQARRRTINCLWCQSYVYYQVPWVSVSGIKVACPHCGPCESNLYTCSDSCITNSKKKSVVHWTQ